MLDPEVEELEAPQDNEDNAGGWFSGLFWNVWDWLPTTLAFLVIYGLLIGFFSPDLMFSQTTTGGGDTGAHHYTAQYLINELLPTGRLTGWAPGWYAGMPILSFYFPFPFLLIAIFNYVLPYTIAFKLVTALGTFLLPLTVYAMGRLWRIRRPFPIIAAAFAMIFLFMERTVPGEQYSILGGNILSTLAGEFGCSLSFALLFLFLGAMYRGMEKPRFNMWFVANCLILMALALSHIITTIVAVCIAPGLLLPHLFKVRSEGKAVALKALAYLVGVGAVGFCLTAFWSLPYAVNLEWTAKMEWTQHSLRYLAPGSFIPILVLGIIGVAYAVARREWRMMPLLWMSVAVLVFFSALPDGMRLWNGRLLGFWYLSMCIWAAYAVAWFLRLFMVLLWDLVRCPTRLSRRIFAPLVVAAVILVVGLSTHLAGGWIRYNYQGYEKQAAYPQYQEILEYIDTLPPHTRVMNKHGAKVGEFGTTRAFELIPYWTQADTMEGTLMEMSYTAAFHFINQRELSEEASVPIYGVDFPPDVDVTAGITHLQFMNIEYFLGYYNADGNDRVMPAVDADPRAELVASFGDYSMYRIIGCSGFVEVMKNEPVRVKVSQDDWRDDVAVPWYKTPSALDTALIWDNGEEALERFASITPEQSTYPPSVPINTEGEVSNIEMGNDSLSFDTTAIGQPHWIKISYFPNWHVRGAEGPFLASPSMMMVIPTEGHVELYYGRTWANTVGQTFEVAAWLLLLGISIWRFVAWRKRDGQPLPEGPDAPDADGVVLKETVPQAPPALPAAGVDAGDAVDAEQWYLDEYAWPPCVYESDDQDIADFEDDWPRR